jgi:Tol biopolymer transport system component
MGRGTWGAPGRLSVVLALPAAALALALAPAAQAAFPGGNGRIAYSAFPGPGDSELFSQNPAGGFLQLTDDTLGQGEPSYSADGKRIAFAQSGPGVTNEIWIMRADGTKKHRITKDHNDAHPAFSPNGRSIVFGRDGGIARMRADGSKAHRITQATGNFLYDYQPTWSPNGRLIAFTSNRIDRNSAITDVWTMRPDGSHKRNLTHSRLVPDGSPDFSPGGGSIVYSSRRDGHTKIWRMRSSGRRRHRVPISGTYSEQFNPAFSPNGRKLVFSSADEFNTINGLFTAPSTGGSAKAMLTGGDLAGEATWQPKPRR